MIGAVAAVVLPVCTAAGQSGDSQGVPPWPGRVMREKPAFTRPPESRYSPGASHRARVLSREKQNFEQRQKESPNRIPSERTAPRITNRDRLTPGSANPEIFPRPKRPTMPRHYVSGGGRSLEGYRLGTRFHNREDKFSRARYYFRNPDKPRPDRER